MIQTTRAAKGSTIAVLGASTKPGRISFLAMKMLKANGFLPIAVHPAGHDIDGMPGVRLLSDIQKTVDTVIVYINAQISSAEKENILALKPRRVIFNPGAENESLAETLISAGIEIVENCTLVLLKTNQF
ncbi:MAG: CoA-binding protein [candidate division Zixibacteria bacterium]|nr:CoA-binding protein [candidate division Zixibacteria bacterium]